MSRARSTVRYASRVTGVNFEKYLVWGGIAAAVYFVIWPVLKGAMAVKEGVDAVINTSRDALASGLFYVFGPTVRDETLFYSVKFPDGKIHAVPSMSVGSNGVFINRNLSPNYAGDGQQYRLLVDSRLSSGNNKVALPL